MVAPDGRSTAKLADLKKIVSSFRTSISTIERLDKDRELNFIEIQKQVDKLKSLETNPQDLLSEWLESYEPELSEARQVVRRRFGAELERLLRPEGMTLSGQLPALKAGIFTIEPDFEAGRVTLWYGPKQERIETVSSLSPKDVLKLIKQQHKSLTSRPLDQEKFLGQLHAAYLGALRRIEKPDGEQVPIISALVEHSFHVQSSRFHIDPRRDNFRSYGRMEFSYDLHRLRQRRLIDRELILTTATRAYSSRRRDFLWIPNDSQGGGSTYSHILFKEVR